MEGNLDNPGFGFIGEAFDVYCPLTPKDEPRLQAIMNDITSNPGWLAHITKLAQEQKIDVQQAVRQNAKFMYDQER